MTLLTCLFAALICTILWYKNAPQNEMKLHVLCYLYWGASLMWMVDAVFEYSRYLISMNDICSKKWTYYPPTSTGRRMYFKDNSSLPSICFRHKLLQQCQTLL